MNIPFAPILAIRPIFLALTGISCIAYALTARLPDKDELAETRGILVKYLIPNADKDSDHLTLLMRDGRRIRTSALSTESAPEVFKKLPARIAVYVLKSQVNVGSVNTIDSYGLTVNGKVIVSVEDALSRKKTSILFFLTAGAIVFILGAVATYDSFVYKL